MGTQKTFVNPILSALYLVANIAILAFTALLFFGLVWALPIAVPVVAAVCAALMIAFTIWAAYKGRFLGSFTIAALAYNNVIAIAAVVLLFLFNGKDFPFPVLFAIPVITFLLCVIFLLYDLLQTVAEPEEEEWNSSYTDEDFIFQPEVGTEEVPAPVEAPAPAPVTAAPQVEMKSVSFEDFADYIEEE